MATVTMEARERIGRAQLQVQPTRVLPGGEEAPARCRPPVPEPFPPPDEGPPPEPRIVPEPFPPPDEGDRPAAADDPASQSARHIAARSALCNRATDIQLHFVASRAQGRPATARRNRAPHGRRLAPRPARSRSMPSCASAGRAGRPQARARRPDHGAAGEDRGGPGQGGRALIGDRLHRGEIRRSRATGRRRLGPARARSSATSRSNRRSSTGSSALPLQTERLDFLRRQYAISLDRLNRRLVELYESDRPDDARRPALVREPHRLPRPARLRARPRLAGRADHDAGQRREGPDARRAREDEGDARQGCDGDADDRRPHRARCGRREGAAPDQREGPLVGQGPQEGAARIGAGRARPSTCTRSPGSRPRTAQ